MIHVSLLVVALWFPAALDDSNPRDVLTGSEKTEHFEIRFRLGSRAEASVDRVKAKAEEDLERILRRLEFKGWNQRIALFLYDDVEELQKITGVPSAGHSSPLESHVPHDNDQTRLHELVHVVAEKFPEKGPEPRSLFFAEGLANAVLEFVHGIPVDAVAAFYRKTGTLPALAEMTSASDFYAWLGLHPGFNGYDVAGSYLKFLIDKYGVAKTRRYYTGTPAKEAFGVGLDKIEKDWLAHLDQFEMRPGLEQLLRERADEPASFTKYQPPEAHLDEKILGPSSEWKSLDRSAIASTTRGEWKWTEEGLSARAPADVGDWSECSLGKDEYGDCIARMRARPVGKCWGVKLTFGQKCQALLLGQGAFIYNDVGGIAFDDKLKLAGQPVEIVLRRLRGKASMWIDGALALEAAVDGTATPLSVGVVQGQAIIDQIAVRPLK